MIKKKIIDEGGDDVFAVKDDHPRLASDISSNYLHVTTHPQPRTSESLHHNDKGCQYTNNDYQQVFSTKNITCSMIRTGC
ncbi:MAG: hypothetical protein AAF664_10120 [Planctomycetota bacterium]